MPEQFLFQDFEEKIGRNTNPVLLACLCEGADGAIDPADREMLTRLEQIVRDVDVYILCGASHGVMNRLYGPLGAPEYLLFKNGEVRGRLLGQADERALQRLLNAAGNGHASAGNGSEAPRKNRSAAGKMTGKASSQASHIYPGGV